MKRRTVAGKLAFEKAWDLAVKEGRPMRDTDIQQMMEERFAGQAEWEEVD